MNQFQLPAHRDLFYGGAWHRPAGGTAATVSPSTGRALGSFAVAGAEDVDRAVIMARAGFAQWRRVAPLERARVLREMARRLAARRDELAWIDAIDGGSPVRELRNDVDTAVAQLDFFAGLVTEMKGASVPMGPGVVNFSVREPLGVVVRIIPFNHPFMFCAGKPASALAAGNAVIVKPPEQAPLSALRIAELADDLFPPGVFSVLTGDGATGAALASHPGVAKVALIGSVSAGRAVMRAGADHIRPVLLELGGKNALIAFADVTQDMTLAREEIFGPVLSVLRWDDPKAMLADVNSTPYGLTCSIWTNDLAAAHETAAAAEAGFVWVNEVARHFLGTAFGGYKQSGTGREECLDELLDFTQQKNIHIRYRPG